MKKWMLMFLMALFVGQAPAFELMDVQGKKLDLPLYKGRWVAVNFWAPWCAPCLEEIPDLSALYESRKKKDLVILGVAMYYKDARQAMDFAQVHKMTYPLVLGMEAGQGEREFGSMDSMPVTLLYNPEGKMVHRRRGLIRGEELIKLIETGSLD